MDPLLFVIANYVNLLIGGVVGFYISILLPALHINSTDGMKAMKHYWKEINMLSPPDNCDPDIFIEEAKEMCNSVISMRKYYEQIVSALNEDIDNLLDYIENTNDVEKLEFIKERIARIRDRHNLKIFRAKIAARAFLRESSKYRYRGL